MRENNAAEGGGGVLLGNDGGTERVGGGPLVLWETTE